MIRTRCQGDVPFFPNMLNNGKVEVCLKEDVDKVIREKDAEIASLKAQIAEAKELSIELQKRNKAIADNAISNVESYKSKRDAEIESLKASHYAEMVDAGMRERKLERALWLARANNAINSYDKWNLFANFESEDKLFTIDEYDETPGVTDFSTLRTYAEWCKVWQNVARKCLKKAEEHK